MKRKKRQLKICVSGSAAGETLKTSAASAEKIGRAIAKSGVVLMTGATTGLPLYAARGAKRAGGIVFGFSPASTKAEHTRKYRLPVEYCDVIVYTGSGYAGRNLILTRSCDAVIVIGGRIGTLNEFTVAFEDRKVIGILEDSGGITSEIRNLLAIAKKGQKHVLFDKDPGQLVARVIKEITIADRHNHHKSRQED